MSRAGVVLCGGRSSRMGRAKAWLPWFGRTMIEHVVDCLSKAVDEVVVVTSASLDLPLFSGQGVRVVRDSEPERGPLAGIRDGLEALSPESEYAFVTSTDAPYLSESFVSSLFDRGCACAPISDGFVQVLSAIYPRSSWIRAKAMLEQGLGRPLSLLEGLGFERVEWDFGTAPPAWQGFNTPAAYLEAVRSRDPEATAEVEFVGSAFTGPTYGSRTRPVGTLGEVLADWPASCELTRDEQIAPHLRVLLGGSEVVRDLAVPIGPGERVRVVMADVKEGAR